VTSVDPDSVSTVVLAGGRSLRMGFDKLLRPFGGEPLIRRVVAALAGLRPLVVTTPAAAALIADVSGVRVVATEPTAGPAVTLALADAAIPASRRLAVLAGDLPFVDAALVRAFLAAVPADADLAWPVVGATPGHPVLWSPRARRRIAGLGPDEAPASVRREPGLRLAPVAMTDDRYVVDVDTPEGWESALARLRA